MHLFYRQNSKKNFILQLHIFVLVPPRVCPGFSSLGLNQFIGDGFFSRQQKYPFVGNGAFFSFIFKLRNTGKKEKEEIRGNLTFMSAFG